MHVEIKNFVQTELACKCCGKFVKNDEALLSLQAFRCSLNRKYKKNIRLHVNSGTRCVKHNKEVGGKDDSQHLEGTAFDLTSPDLNYNVLYKEAVASRLFSTVIKYPKKKFVHADTRFRVGFAISAWIQ